MHYNFTDYGFCGVNIKTRDGVTEEAVVYSQPTKPLWRRIEHVYTEIGPPGLPTRGYKNDPSQEEELQYQGYHDAIDLTTTVAVV